MSAFVLAIDQGTTNTKALALDPDGRIVARHSVPTPIAYPRPGWVEQSGDEIWRATTAAIDGCLSALPEPATIAAIGVSNQRETVLLWRRSTGETIGPCVTWQCRRSSDRIDALRTPAIEEAVQSKTGLGLDPLFPAAKIGWLLEAYPEARSLSDRGDLCAGTIDSWLLFNLTGGAIHATDASNASRTQLFDIHQQEWSDELCGLFGVPKSILPRVEDSNARFGAAKNVHRLIEGVAVHAMMGDSHAALFGHGIRSPGAVKATYGTGSSLMTLTETPIRSRSGLSTTVAWRRSKTVSYALEGNISVSAQAAAWMAELMGLPDVAALTELATKAKGDDGVCFVPALAGLGAPYWKDRARAALTGMSLATSRADVARATLEAIALADPRRLHRDGARSRGAPGAAVCGWRGDAKRSSHAIPGGPAWSPRPTAQGPGTQRIRGGRARGRNFGTDGRSQDRGDAQRRTATRSTLASTGSAPGEDRRVERGGELGDQ